MSGDGDGLGGGFLSAAISASASMGAAVGQMEKIPVETPTRTQPP